MTEVKFTDELVVELLDSNFSDTRVCIAARTSTAGAGADPKATAGLINSLMRNRHGSPFEHMSATFRVTAPIFVWREHHRHRIASYSEESGRYKVLEPLFYVPGPNRPLVQEGKPMEYKVGMGTPGQYDAMEMEMQSVCTRAYEAYERLMEKGVMREVARMVLPVNIMSTCIVTMNARGLMNFLSLRVRDDNSKFPSTPMIEINLIANGYEQMFKDFTPLTHAAFIDHGRVAP